MTTEPDAEQALADAAADLNTPPSDEHLAGVARLALEQLELEDFIARLEDKLKQVKEKLRDHSTKTLPDALRALGLSEFKLTDGSKVAVKTVISASIPVANRPAAFAWLRENGLEDLIKHQLVINLVRGQDEKAQALIAETRKLGLAHEDKESVHAQTLGAFVRERIAAHGELPFDTFGVFVGSVAEVTRPGSKSRD